MRVNLDGLFFGTRAAISAMQPDGAMRDHFGSIIILSSILGLVGSATAAAYSASKGAVRLFAKSVALDARPRAFACASTRSTQVTLPHPCSRPPLRAAPSAKGRTLPR
jgi:NAD(P)-dependent dehydrogenase (short-subunit alcohol dehydrogenase family)